MKVTDKILYTIKALLLIALAFSLLASDPYEPLAGNARVMISVFALFEVFLIVRKIDG